MMIIIGLTVRFLYWHILLQVGHDILACTRRLKWKIRGEGTASALDPQLVVVP